MVESPHAAKASVQRGLTLAVLVAVASPYLSRLTWSSLYMDDVARVAFRQTEPLSHSLLRPFNEHLSPLFEVVTWSTWNLAGRQLSRAPLAFTLGSYLPFALTLGALYRLARLELRDAAAALAALVFFAISSLANETVFWYSASSFMWALLGTLLAWDAAARATQATTRARRGIWLAVSVIACAAAPCFCGLGLLAGPLAVLRYWLGSDNAVLPSSRSGNGIRGLIPGLGTLAFLALAVSQRMSEVISTSARRNLDLTQGLLCIPRATVDVLLPGMVGPFNLDRFLPGAVEVALFGAVLAVLVVWVRRSPAARPVVLAGVGLILGGYGLTYPLRASSDPAWVITVQRYHLFPQAGLALLLAAALQPVGASLKARASWLPQLATLGLALLLLVTQSSSIKRHARFFRYPEQTRTLAALDRVADISRSMGVARSEVLQILDPIRTAWTPDPRLFNALQMLPDWPTPVPATRPDRAAILAALSERDREALCAGMDASRHLVRLSTVAPLPGTPGEPATLSQFRLLDQTGRFESQGELAFVEFQWPATMPAPEGMLLAEPAEGEIWWTNANQEWSPLRSATWVLPEGQSSYVLPLTSLPHWQWSGRKLRVVIRKKEPVAIATPRLLR